jgi:cytidyltransferase-like protein
MEKFGYFHGRFQPFHNGHLEVVKFALKHCDALVIGISNPLRSQPVFDETFAPDAVNSMLNARSPANNPWPFWARLLMIREGLRSADIELQRIIILPNLNNTGLPADEIRLPKNLCVIFVSSKDAHNNSLAQQYVSQGWNTIEIPEVYFNASARVIRRKIETNESWEDLVPNGTSEVIKLVNANFPI